MPASAASPKHTNAASENASERRSRADSNSSAAAKAKKASEDDAKAKEKQKQDVQTLVDAYKNLNNVLLQQEAGQDAALAAAGLSRVDISDTIDEHGQLLPGGTVDDGEQTLSVQIGARLGSVDDVADLPLTPEEAETMPM